MGVVYLAQDERLDREVALKVLPPGALNDDAARKSFRKEALLVSRLNHPGIATVHDFDTEGETDFLVMEYIPGPTLEERLAGGCLTEKEVARLAPQAANALAAAHQQGVIHCDLKPGNLKITSDGRLKILDFGLARRLALSDLHLRDTLTDAKTTAGTLPYMSPEQLRGEKVDARSDLYAFGAVLYEMCTGKRPFPETWGPQLIDAIMHQVPVPPHAVNSRVSPAIENIIMKAMDKDPDRRYQSAREMAVDLERLTGPVAIMAPPRRPAPRWSLVVPAAGAATLALLALVAAGAWRGWFTSRSPAPRIEAIAVLPLENLLGNPEQDFLADAMTEALIAHLAKVGSLRVVSRTSVLQYKGVRKPLEEIARELNVDAVVEGSVLQSGDRVRITAQLIDVATDRHLWADTFDRDASDILTMQSDVAGAIVKEIGARVGSLDLGRVATEKPLEKAAHDAYVKGRYHGGRPTVEDQKKSIQHLEEAIRQKPDYALAHAALADTYLTLLSVGGIAPAEAHAKAAQEAEAAVALGRDLSEAHGALARVKHLAEWDWPGAENTFRVALELGPSTASVHEAYAFYLSDLGRTGEAVSEIERALELDPLSIRTNIAAGVIHSAAGLHDRAIEALSQTLAMAPESAAAREALGWAYLAKGVFEEAVGAFKTAVETPGSGWTGVVGLGCAYAASGRRIQAAQLLGQLEDLSPRRFVSAVGIAAIHARLGETDLAFEWLERAYRDRDSELVHLRTNRSFEMLRSDSRLKDLLRRLGPPT